MIGIFDSGLGGLTVVKEVLRRLPGRGVLYFGDTARTPYGTKSPELVTRYAVEDAAFLLSNGATVLVVACNTASSVAVPELRRRFDVPVFEVVTPAVRRAAAVAERKVGVIGTNGTVRSGVYERGMAGLRPEVAVISQACPLFVPLVEEGWADRPETRMVAERYLYPLHSQDIDTLVLGCTHYPFLRDVIGAVVGPKVALVDPAAETVAELARYLEDRPDLDAELRRADAHRFCVSDRTERFEQIASDWLDMPVRLELAAADAAEVR